MSDGPAPSAAAAAAFAPVSRFADGLRHASWFAAVGQMLAPDERREATDYVAAIGFAKAIVVTAPDWRRAEAITRDAHWTHAWWDAEERARVALLAKAKAQGEPALMAALSRVTLAASDVVLGAASIAAARAGIADPSLARVAAGAATQGGYQAGLALAAGGRRRAPVRHQVPALRRRPLAARPGRRRVLSVLARRSEHPTEGLLGGGSGRRSFFCLFSLFHRIQENCRQAGRRDAALHRFTASPASSASAASPASPNLPAFACFSRFICFTHVARFRCFTCFSRFTCFTRIRPLARSAGG